MREHKIYLFYLLIFIIEYFFIYTLFKEIREAETDIYYSISCLHVSDEIFYLQDLGGINVYKIFDQKIAANYIRNSPINEKIQRHFIFITLSTSDYLENMKICIKSAFKHGLKANELIIMSLDSDVYTYFISQNIQTMFLNYTKVLQASWFVVGRLKQAIQYYFNCYDTDVLFFESDMIFCNNFIDEMIERMNEESVDIQIMEERHDPKRSVDLSPAYYGYNIGLMLVKSSNKTRILFRRWLHDCYFTKDNLWDQNMFNFIITNNAHVFGRNQSAQILFYRFHLEDQIFKLTFHFLNPVKFINYCSLIQETANHFNTSKIDLLLRFANEMNLKRPNLLHFACINNVNKFTYMKKIDLNEDSYKYHMDYLKKFKFSN